MALTEERFWKRVAVGGADECWEWTGPMYGTSYADRDGKRYGRYTGAGSKRNRRVWCAHRFAYTVTVGPIPAGAIVRHRCDNPPCCNPAHLEIGTHRDNALDALARGRAGQPTRGERSATCRYPDSVVAAIRADHAAGLGTYGELAKKYGCPKSTVGQVVRGERRAA